MPRAARLRLFYLWMPRCRLREGRGHIAVLLAITGREDVRLEDPSFWLRCSSTLIAAEGQL